MLFSLFFFAIFVPCLSTKNIQLLLIQLLHVHVEIFHMKNLSYPSYSKPNLHRARKSHEQWCGEENVSIPETYKSSDI